MHSSRVRSAATLSFVILSACKESRAPETPSPISAPLPPATSANDLTVLNLADVKSHPSHYEWFDFKPNVRKLILAGAPEAQHVAILWYTVEHGAVGLHYHAKTESVYVIGGSQTDGKGTYRERTVYFNPPGSGHQISESSGFFLLAYAAPPDFKNTDRIGQYEPVRIDLNAAALAKNYPFKQAQAGVRTFTVPLVAEGGMRAHLIETASPKAYSYSGNYLLVLDGKCAVNGMNYAKDTLLVQKKIAPSTYAVTAPSGASCLSLGVSF